MNLIQLHIYETLIYFVLICFNFLSVNKKLFAYAFGIIFRSFGSCTKYSYPCFSANLIASSLVLKLTCVPCMKSADDCQPISRFSHLYPLPNTSQSIRHWWQCQSPDCVAVFVGRYIRTVLAWSSIGAPDSTAAGKTLPSPLPFITRIGTGVNSDEA